MKNFFPGRRGRGPVQHLNRNLKAKMIEFFLKDALRGPIEGGKILDIGSGNGDISDFFSKKNHQYSVDVQDVRRNKHTNVTFTVVDSENLPFENGYFDIVISNHVIEHLNVQGRHLDEIHRVLKSSGVCYIGTPNKSSPIMEGHINNDKVLHFNQMIPLLKKHGFRPEPLSIKLLKQPHKYHCELPYGRFFPLPILKRLQPFFPSHSFLLWPVKQPVRFIPSLV